MNQYTCTKGKDGKIYVFTLNDQGRKVRTKNDNVRYCDNIPIPECKTLCRKTSPAKKLNTPCKKKKGYFINKAEVVDYCKHKPPGDYARNKRQKIADVHNKVLKGEINEEQGDKMLKKIYKQNDKPIKTTQVKTPRSPKTLRWDI